MINSRKETRIKLDVVEGQVPAVRSHRAWSGAHNNLASLFDASTKYLAVRNLPFYKNI